MLNYSFHKKGVVMKKVLIVVSIFVFVGFCCIGCKKEKNEVTQDIEVSQDIEEEYDQPTNEASHDLLIRPGIGVGKVQFGMTVQQMKDVLGKPDVASTGISYMYTSLGIEIVARDDVVSHIYCGNPHGKSLPIVKTMEESCKFKTAEGLGIDSTESQIVKAFGQPTKRKGNQLFYKDKRTAFFLSDDKVIGIVLMK